MERIIKPIITAFLLLIIMSSQTQYAYASEINYVRVGVGSSASTIAFSGDNINVFFLVDGKFISVGLIDSGSSYNISADDYYYVSIGKTYNNYSAALSDANNYTAQGYFSLPVLLESGVWSVYAGPVTTKAEAESIMRAGVGRAVIEPTGKRLVLGSGSSRLALFENNQYVPYFSSTYTNTIKVNTTEYRGYLNAFRKNTTLTPVNTLPMEDYLYSSVASEMPSSWHAEALKAQSVASRCYAYSKLGAHGDNGYDLCSSDHCQIYLGLKQEKESATNAVNATAGLVAYYEDELINATFFSSSGGATDDSENVWINALPYLRGVSDTYDVTGKEWSRTFTLAELTNIASLNNYAIGSVTGVEISNTSSSGRVQELIIKGTAGNKTLAKEEIRTFFSKSTGGSLESRYFRLDQFGVSVASTSANTNQNAAVSTSTVSSNLYVRGDGRSAQRDTDIISIINGSGDNISVAYFDNVSLQSSSGQYNMPVSVSADRNTPSSANSGVVATVSGGLASSGSSVTFAGKGWGHGVGLSQHGAKGMAEAGFTFEQILKHYYSGVEIFKIN